MLQATLTWRHTANPNEAALGFFAAQAEAWKEFNLAMTLRRAALSDSASL